MAKIEEMIGPTREYFRDNWVGPDTLAHEAAIDIRREFKEQTGLEMSYDLSYRFAALTIAVCGTQDGLRALTLRRAAETLKQT